ncbi:MAG: hypothetical protein M5U13_03650 [Thermoanaerobaculia bacterium]|nr:hypothetical protein [Thermoanaerobaculia bacterium]
MPTPALHEPSTPVPPAGSRLALAFLVATAVALPPAAGAAAWRPEGPDTGNVRDVAFDPHRPGTVWAATANGGVWRSGDGGRSWTLPGTGMMGRKIEWLEPDPGTAGTLWAGIDSPGRPSLFRSRDDGATWERVTDRYPGVLGTLQPTGARIAFAPSRPAEIWVPSTNLHYRSRDGGKTWSDFRVPGQDAYVFAVDPADPQVVYAGGRGDTHHLSRSDDGGASWTPVGEGLDGTLRLLVVDPSAPQVVWTVVGFNQLHRSADRGRRSPAWRSRRTAPTRSGSSPSTPPTPAGSGPRRRAGSSARPTAAPPGSAPTAAPGATGCARWRSTRRHGARWSPPPPAAASTGARTEAPPGGRRAPGWAPAGWSASTALRARISSSRAPAPVSSGATPRASGRRSPRRSWRPASGRRRTACRSTRGPERSSAGSTPAPGARATAAAAGRS